MITKLQDDLKSVRPVIEQTRPNSAKFPDVDRLEDQVKKLVDKWNGHCSQITDRLEN